MQQRHLPEYKRCPVTFLNSILGHTAEVFLNSEVNRLRVPEWPELSIRLVMPVALTVPGLREHLPLEWADRPDKVDRQFFWDVLSTLDHSFALALIADVGK